MNIKDFDYELPSELIANKPVEKRDNSRLLVADRAKKTYEDKRFFDIFIFFNPGDVLVVNNSKVIPARLVGKKKSGGKAEILLNTQILEDTWEGLCNNLKLGDIINFENSNLVAEILGKRDKIYQIKFNFINNEFWREIDKIGQTPLPPYIEKKLKKRDENYHRERYQTEYAKNKGSVAAPTAGLHFSKELLRKIKKKGVEIVYVTLHVGLGTFLPVETADVEKHKIHKEYFSVLKNQYQKIKNAKEERKRIFACGTTVVRVLEHLASKDSLLGGLDQKNLSGWTDIFIYPGYEFKMVDAMITNFHLPKSTLLMLVSAFVGSDFTKKLYQHAIEEKYRFYSYGDAMLLI